MPLLNLSNFFLQESAAPSLSASTSSSPRPSSTDAAYSTPTFCPPPSTAGTSYTTIWLTSNPASTSTPTSSFSASELPTLTTTVSATQTLYTIVPPSVTRIETLTLTQTLNTTSSDVPSAINDLEQPTQLRGALYFSEPTSLLSIILSVPILSTGACYPTVVAATSTPTSLFPFSTESIGSTITTAPTLPISSAVQAGIATQTSIFRTTVTALASYQTRTHTTTRFVPAASSAPLPVGSLAPSASRDELPRSQVSKIIGGVVGGVVGTCFMLLAFLYLIRPWRLRHANKSSKTHALLGEKPSPKPGYGLVSLLGSNKRHRRTSPPLHIGAPPTNPYSSQAPIEPRNDEQIDSPSPRFFSLYRLGGVLGLVPPADGVRLASIFNPSRIFSSHSNNSSDHRIQARSERKSGSGPRAGTDSSTSDRMWYHGRPTPDLLAPSTRESNSMLGFVPGLGLNLDPSLQTLEGAAHPTHWVTEHVYPHSMSSLPLPPPLSAPPDHLPFSVETPLPPVLREDQQPSTHAPSPLALNAETATAPFVEVNTAPPAGTDTEIWTTSTTPIASTEAGASPNDPFPSAAIPAPSNWLMGLPVDPSQSYSEALTQEGPAPILPLSSIADSSLASGRFPLDFSTTMVPVTGTSTSEQDRSSTSYNAPTVGGSSFVQRQSGTPLVHHWSHSHASSIYAPSSRSLPHSHGPSRNPSHSRSIAWPRTAWPATSLLRGSSEHNHAPPVAEDSETGSALFAPFFRGMRTEYQVQPGPAETGSPRSPDLPATPTFHSVPRTGGSAASPTLPTVPLLTLFDPARSHSVSHSPISPLATIVAGGFHFPPSSRYTRTLGKLDAAVEHGPAIRRPTLLTLQSSALPYRYAAPVALTRSSSSPALARGARSPSTILGHRSIKSNSAAQHRASTSGEPSASSFFSATKTVIQGTQSLTFVTPSASVRNASPSPTVVTQPTTPRRPSNPSDPEGLAGTGGHSGSTVFTVRAAHVDTAYSHSTQRPNALTVVNAEVRTSSSEQEDLQQL